MKSSDKQIIILLIILAAILIIFFSYKGISKLIESKKSKTISYNVFENFNPDLINKIFVEDAIGNSKFELQKIDNNWEFISPQKYITDNSIIQSYLIGFQQLYYKDKFEIESDLSLSHFGLDNPQKTFIFEYFENGKQIKTGIIFGKNIPSNDGIYLKVIDKPYIYVITLDAIQLIDFNANQLRNKQIFSNINRDDIALIKFINNLTKDENIIELDGQKYYFTASYNPKASKLLIPDESIKSIVDRLFYLSAVDVLDEMPKNYNVEYEIIIVLKNGQSIKCSIFKKEKSPDDVQELFYAINDSTKEIFTITMTTLKSFFSQRPYLLDELMQK